MKEGKTMEFGKVDHPEQIDFTLPEDHPDTAGILSQSKANNTFNVYVGCAKWNRQDLKGFYPRGTKDELAYYATQFNAIELNASFYRAPGRTQIRAWAAKTPDGFKFFPKIPSIISHMKRLIDVESLVINFCESLYNFDEKLGMVFLQLHENFQPKDFDRIVHFVETFPRETPLAVELRNPKWFSDKKAFDDYSQLLETNGRTSIIVDTAGRRDMLHMRLTSDTAFIRFVGANHHTDYSRLDDWVDRVVQWQKLGLTNLYFFIHQHIEKESPLLSAHFIKKLDKATGISLKVPLLATIP